MAHALLPYLLLVEDNPGDARLTQAMFDEAPGAASTLACVTTATAAQQWLDTHPGCVAILLDLGLPDCQGLEAVDLLKAHTGDVPIVVLTGIDNDQLGLAAVVAGAQDYLVKGSFDAALLRRSLSYAVQRKQVERALVERALHDELTGLPSRRLLVDRIGSAQRRCARDALQGALLFLDLDRFKQVNDQYGHATGDAVLREVARRLAAVLRASDTLARVGGDEFVVLLPSVTGPLDAEGVGQKLIEAVLALDSVDGCDVAFDASVGITLFQAEGMDADVLLHRADAAMYAAKQAGGGRTWVL